MNSIDLRLGNGKSVGWIDQKSAVLPVTSRNYLAVGRGYSVDRDVLGQIREHECAEICFFDERKKQIFKIGVPEFLANARTFNFGYGEKLVAPQTLYSRIDRRAQDANA